MPKEKRSSRKAMTGRHILPSIEHSSGEELLVPNSSPVHNSVHRKKYPTGKREKGVKQLSDEDSPAKKCQTTNPLPGQKVESRAASTATCVKRAASDSSDMSSPQYRRDVLSPVIWNATLRDEKLNREGFVELPREVADIETMEKRLSAKKRFLRRQQILEKGKFPARESRDSSFEFPLPKMNREGTATNAFATSQELKTVSEHDNNISSVHVGATIIPIRQGMCTCTNLPDFFTRDWGYIPPERHWPGSRSEFLQHMRQIASCRGHQDRVRWHCQRIVRAEDRRSEITSEAVAEVPEKVLSSANIVDRTGRDVGLPQACSSPHRKLSTTKNRSKTSRLGGRKPPRTRNPTLFTAQPAIKSEIIGPRHPASSSNRSFDGGVSLVQGSQAEQRTISTKSRRKVKTADYEDELSESSMPATNLTTSPSSQGSNGGTQPKALEKVTKAGGPDGSRVATDSHISRPISNSKKRRHALRLSPTPTAPRFEGVEPTYRSRLESAPQPVSPNIAHLNHSLQDLTTKVNEIKGMLLPMTALNQDARNNDVVDANGNGELIQRQKRRKTVADRKLDKPELSRDVEKNLRLSDAALLDIGRRANGYERHQRAPYAFSWYGRLYAEYDYLLGKVDQNDRPLWDWQVSARLKSR